MWCIKLTHGTAERVSKHVSAQCSGYILERLSSSLMQTNTDCSLTLLLNESRADIFLSFSTIAYCNGQTSRQQEQQGSDQARQKAVQVCRNRADHKGERFLRGAMVQLLQQSKECCKVAKRQASDARQELKDDCAQSSSVPKMPYSHESAWVHQMYAVSEYCETRGLARLWTRCWQQWGWPRTHELTANFNSTCTQVTFLTFIVFSSYSLCWVHHVNNMVTKQWK